MPAENNHPPLNPPSAPASTSGGVVQRSPPNIEYVDRPELQEIFADSITGLIFEGQMLRMEFGVTRLDEVTPNAPFHGRRYPACRVVLPSNAAVDLINRIQQIAAALVQAGVMKTGTQPSPGNTKTT
jgi:hypothetical protein